MNWRTETNTDSAQDASRSADAAYHWPADLLPLLVETIPRLFRSKRDVIQFFQGAGVPRPILGPVDNQLRTRRESLNKFEIVRRILAPLNERGDATLAARREVVRRVVEFEEFSTCWPKDLLAAQGLVAQVRALVNRRDSFTRMRDRADAAEGERLAASRAKAQQLQDQRETLAQLRSEFYGLFNEEDPQLRVKQLEAVLNNLFEASGILIHEAFTVKGEPGEGVIEQIDGVIGLDGDLYLVEVKWLKVPVGPGDAAQHLVRVHSRAQARGILVSASGFTAAVESQHRDALVRGSLVVLCGLDVA